MAYGEIKVDTVTFTDGGIDKSVSISGLVQNPTFSGNITVTGTISGNTVQGQTVSGVTVTGTTANFVSGVFTTQISGATITGNVGSFTTITGGTVTLTSGVFASGTAAAPSVSIGTTDNGLYSPGTDQVAVATNGTGRLFVDASGNVGVGTSSVNALLEVNNSTAGGEVQRIEGNYDGSGSVILTNWRRAGGSVAAALKYNDDSSPLCMSIGTTTSHEFRIRTADTDAITIDASQRVGIGTSSPNVPLDIESSAGTAVKIRLASNTSNRALAFSNAAETIGWTVGNGVIASARQFVVYDNEAGAARLLIDSSGNVGIGTTTVSDKLHVADGNITFSYADGSTGLRNKISWRTESPFFDETAYIAVNRTGVSGAPADIVLATGGAGTATEKARLTSAGLVGIGTSSPSNLLTLNAPNANALTLFVGPGTGEYSSIRGKYGAGNDYAQSEIRFINADNPNGRGALAFAVGTNSTTEHMRITYDGKVGIGTTSPAQLLHLKGSGDTKLLLNSANNTSDRGIYFATSTDSEVLGYIKQEYSTGQLQISSGTGGYASDVAFRTAGFERAKIDISGRLLVGTSSSSSTSAFVIQGYAGVSAGAGEISITRGGTPSAADQGLGTIRFQNNNGNTGAQIDAFSEGSWTAGSNHRSRLTFSTTADGASSPTERMRITSGGNVGIGTTTVNNGVLHVKSNGTGSQSGLAVEASANDSFFSITNNGSTHTLGATYNSTGSYQPISFDINGEKARIDTSGRLLVGTSSSFDANCTLQAVGGNAAQFFRWGADGCNVYIGCARGTQGSPSTLNNGDIIGSLKFRGHDGSAYRDGASITAAVDATTGASDFPSRLEFSTTADGAGSPTERLRIDSSGQVGIGTTSPVNVGAGYNGLTVNGSTASTIYLQGGGTSSGRLVATSTDFYIGTVQAGGNLIFQHQDGSYERARIDSSGRLLVGTSSARSDFFNANTIAPVFQVQGTGNYRIVSITAVDTSSQSGASLILAKSRSTGNTIVQSGDYLGQLSFQGSDGVEIVEGASIAAIVDGTPGSNDLPTRLVFSTTADGASSPTERMRINNSGNVGIGNAYIGTAVRLVTKGNGTSSSGYAFEAQDSGENTLLYCRNDGYINTGTRAVSPYNNTTASAANVNLFSDGGLYRSTSSIRYKTDVETIENQYSDALLECRPVWYKSLCAGDNKEWGYWGFIAEEVAQIDPRLCFFKEEEGGTLEPEGVQYDRFVPHLLNLIKRQKEQIEAMEARLSALESA
jgi:hypothetical protein